MGRAHDKFASLPDLRRQPIQIIKQFTTQLCPQKVWAFPIDMIAW